jgi:cobalt-zinc-cadmium efflux system membrane fusion protein
MLATMLIQAAAVERIVVPAEAVVRENNADHVFVETAPQLPPDPGAPGPRGRRPAAGARRPQGGRAHRGAGLSI